MTLVKPGDRVAYAATIGAYSQFRNIAADRLVHIPDVVSDEAAAAMMLKGYDGRIICCSAFFRFKKGTRY